MPRLSGDIKAFRDFTGEKPSKVTRTRLPDRDVTGFKLGKAVGVAYEARRDGKTERYFHEFKRSAAPDLVAAEKGRKLYFTGGALKVTSRGIEDMPHLFVVNPSARAGASKRKKPMARRRRATRTRTHRRTQVAVFNANPVKRRRRRRAAVRGFRRNPIRRTRRHTAKRRSYRRNPSARSTAMSVGKFFLPALGIGAGAVGTEVIMGYLPIPPHFKTGIMRHVTKGAVGVTAGLILGKVLRQKKLGNYFALGALVIASHDAIKEFISGRMAGVQMNGMGYLPRSATRGALGYVNPAAAARLGYAGRVHGGLDGHHNAAQVGGETGTLV